MYESDVHASPNPAGENSVKAKFPEGLRVLVVDDNMVCLKLIAALLNKCRYKVTATTKAKEALEMLRKNKESYDIVITDVIMLDMDGFELLEIIGLEMDMPVIMMSANDDKESVMKGVKHGARDYLLKPVRLEEVKNIWQHVIRKNLFNPTKTGTAKAGTDQNLMPSKRQRDKIKEEEEEEDDETNTQSNGESSAHKKKKRVVWTKVLHNKFVDAVRQLEVDKAVPKRILEIMNEPEISRENVASHLQKYRNALRKESRNAKISQESENNINQNKANEILSDTMTASSINQGLNVVNHHNRFAEQGGMSIAGFGSRLQMFGASTSNMKLEKNLLPPQVADQMHTTVLGSAPPAPFFGANLSPQPELNGMRFHSIHSRAKMVDDNVGISSSHLPSFKAGQPGPSSLPVGFGPCSCPPAAFNLAGVPFQMLGDTSTQLNPISQADSLAMMLPLQHEGRNLAYLNGKVGTTSFPFDMRGQITDEATQKGQFVQHRYPFESTEREREGNGHHINSSSSPDDDLLSIMVKQFSSNSAPRL